VFLLIVLIVVVIVVVAVIRLYPSAQIFNQVRRAPLLLHLEALQGILFYHKSFVKKVKICLERKLISAIVIKKMQLCIIGKTNITNLCHDLDGDVIMRKNTPQGNYEKLRIKTGWEDQ